MMPKIRNKNNKIIQGKELDNYILSELLAMEREGLEKSPIQPSTLHARLKAKGIINGKLSTLSTPVRKKMIEEAKQRQHSNNELSDIELSMLTQGRTGAAYIRKAERLEKELDDLKYKYNRNILAVMDIIANIDATSPFNIEDLLADDLIQELATKKKVNK
ncbi:hypothetical protein C0W59_07540 [Photobacterium kishitanii]|uniref:hypothetical protein n=1 Tax=Photobacterium kishitanii TaxID=318456 RepID=UPI000D17AD03|nr:hypothetical protein [Photobacterium kishitanii]PSV16571.1 hypothetical protein C0W59_07540 [Photobacterium kishitanii]